MIGSRRSPWFVTLAAGALCLATGPAHADGPGKATPQKAPGAQPSPKKTQGGTPAIAEPKAHATLVVDKAFTLRWNAGAFPGDELELSIAEARGWGLELLHQQLPNTGTASITFTKTLPGGIEGWDGDYRVRIHGHAPGSSEPIYADVIVRFDPAPKSDGAKASPKSPGTMPSGPAGADLVVPERSQKVPGGKVTPSGPSRDLVCQAAAFYDAALTRPVVGGTFHTAQATAPFVFTAITTKNVGVKQAATQVADAVVVTATVPSRPPVGVAPPATDLAPGESVTHVVKVQLPAGTTFRADGHADYLRRVQEDSEGNNDCTTTVKIVP